MFFKAALGPVCGCTTARKVCNYDTRCQEPQFTGSSTTYYYDCNSTDYLCGSTKGYCDCLRTW